jgi:hypothetical protein
MSPKFRQALYYLGTIVPGVLGLALIWGGIDQGAADNLGSIIAGVLAMLGATAPATAAVKVNQQRKDGTLDDLSPSEQVAKSVQSVIEAQVSANSEAEKVKQVISGAVATVSGLGPLVQQILNAHSAPPDMMRGQRF